MSKSLGFVASSACLLALFAGATATNAVQMPVATLAPATGANVLRAGTQISLRTNENLVSDKKLLRVGQRIQLAVAENVTLNGMIVIPAGSVATGEVTDVRYKGMWGKSGGINGRVLSVRVGDRQIRLTGAFDDEGTTGTAGVVAAIVLVPIAGFFVTGTSARISMVSFVKAFLDEDIAIAAAAPVVVAVPVVAAAPIVTAVPVVATAPVVPAKLH